MKKQLIIISILFTSACLGGCFETSTQIENEPPIVSISVDSKSVYRTMPIIVTVSSYDTDGFVTSYLVNFGDGTISNGSNLLHIYNKTGVYNIIATVMDNNGTESSSNITIIVEEPFIITIDANVTKGIFPLTVAFRGIANDAIGNITGYFWDFHDGSSIDEQNPIHTFKNPDKYTVKLTVFSDRGENISDSITIIAEHRPSFKITGKIVNNYQEEIDVDCAVIENYNEWSYWAPTITILPYEEKDFSYTVKTGYTLYYFWAQWFYKGTSKEGCDIAQYTISNPSEEDLILYVEIKNNGDAIVSTKYNPPNPPKTPIITSQNAYIFDRNTCVYGVIKNVGASNIKDISIRIKLYDSGNNVIATETTSPFIPVIATQKSSYFYTYFFWKDYYHHYTIEVTNFDRTNDQPYNDLIILDHGIEDYGYVYPDKKVTGVIKNTGSKVVDSVRIYSFFYDSTGNILITKYGYVGTLYAGQEKTFEIKVYYFSELEKLPSPISSYDLKIYYR